MIRLCISYLTGNDNTDDYILAHFCPTFILGDLHLHMLHRTATVPPQAEAAEGAKLLIWRLEGDRDAAVEPGGPLLCPDAALGGPQTPPPGDRRS